MPASDQGPLSERYTLVPRTLIFLMSDEHVLLLKGAPDKRLWANQYNGVGGHVERGEDVVRAAYRELEEETGIVGANLWLCGVITIDAGQNTGIGIYVLRGECSQCEPIDSQEGSLKWVPWEELHKLPLVEDLQVLLPRIIDMEPGEPPFSAHYSYDGQDKLQITFG